MRELLFSEGYSNFKQEETPVLPANNNRESLMSAPYKNAILLAAVFILNLFCFSAFAQVDASLAIKKITTNPSSVYSDQPNGRDNDGSALVYLTEQYAGKVAEVIYHVRDLPAIELNPLMHVPAKGDVISLPGLRRNIYEITALKLNDGRTIRFLSYARPVNSIGRYSKNIFVVYTIDPQMLPFELIPDILPTISGSRAAIFSQRLTAAANKINPASAGPATQGANCDQANWVVTSIAPGYWNGFQYVYALNMKNTCNGLTATFHCISIHNGNGDSYVGEIFTWISGTPCDGSLKLRPSTSSQNMGMNGPACCPTGDVIITGPNTGCQGTSVILTANWSGAAGVTYLWSNGMTGASIILTLASPSISVTATSANGCKSTTTYNITVNPIPNPTYTKTDPTCTTATGTIAVSSATAGLTFSFDAGFYSTTASWSGLAAGSTHMITAKSASGCTGSTVFLTIGAAVPGAAVPTLTKTDPTCTTATGTIAVSSATTGLTFSFDGGAYSTTSSWNGLPAGSTHTVTAKNTSGCISSPLSITLGTVPAGPAAPALTKTDPTCTIATGTIAVSSATAGLTFSFDGAVYSSTSSWSGLTAGSTHTVTAKNASGCISTAASITLGTQPQAVQVSVTGNQTICSVDSTKLTATAIPAAGATYSWTTGSPAGSVAGTGAVLTVKPAVATTYFITVTGVSGCTDTKSILVNAPRPALILTSVITICKGNSQDVIADNGGIAGYTYRWLAPALVLNQTTPVLSNMAPLVTTGYTVERTTPDGCKDTATSIIKVYEQPVIGTVAKTDAGCSGVNDGTITINAVSPSNLVLEYSINGTVWTTNNLFTSLTPGSYSILVRNQNGICQAVTGTNILIGRLAGPQDTIKGQTVSCALENVQFVADPATAGATYSWSATGNPVITGGTTGGTFTASWSTAGVYTVTMVVTANGCSTTQTKTINVSNAVIANAGPDKTICQGGITRIGTAPVPNVQVTYSWTPTTGLNDPTVAQPTASPVRTTVYTLTVTNPVTGCVRSDDVEVQVDVNLNPRADAGPDKMFANTPGTTISIGGPNTSPNPFQGYQVDYTWTGVNIDVPAANLSDPWIPVTNFIVPGNAANTYTYVLDVRKIVPAGTEAGNPLFQYCHSYDTMQLVKITAPITLSGNLWNNGNGNNTIDVATGEIKTSAGQTVYAVLTDANDKVVAVAPIAADGSYSFNNIPANTNGYTVIASSTAPITGSTFVIADATLPSNWVYLGSQPGTGNNNPVNGNGYVKVNTGTTNITEVNIGFDRLPIPVGTTLPGQFNPGGTATVSIPAADFTGTDPEDGSNINTVPGDNIHYTAFPSNITSIVIGGITYIAPDAVTVPAGSVRWPAAGVTVPVNTAVAVDPVDGAVTVVIPFKVIDMAGQESPATANVTVPFTIRPFSLSPKVFLQGALFDVSGVDNTINYLSLMRDDLRRNNLLPVSDPYRTATYSALFPEVNDNTAGVVTSPATVFSDKGNNSIVDWVLVELHSNTNPATVIATRAALVQRDGDVVGLDGVSPVVFDNVTGNAFYVAIRHRNHLGAMTKTPVVLNPDPAGTTIVDFSVPSTQLYALAPDYDGYAEVNAGGIRALYAGNAYLDNRLVYGLGLTNGDDNYIMNFALNYPGNTLHSPLYNFAIGYDPGDVNLNGRVRYQGTYNDVDYIKNNIITYPPNTSGSILYTFLREQIPH